MTIGKILIPLTGTLERTDVLDMGLNVGGIMSSHVEALFINADHDEVMARGYKDKTVGWLYKNHDILPQLLKATRDKARTAFDVWAERNNIGSTPRERSDAGNISACWRECTGVPQLVIADFGRFCDLIIMERPDAADTAGCMAQTHAALFQASRPVLLTPPVAAKRLGGDALVGWNSSPEALPLLSQMHRVTLITIRETDLANSARDEELLDYLACHGVRPDRVTLEPDRRSAGARLLYEAATMGADFLVVGAGTHSQMHEVLFGSSTLDVVQTAELPIFLAS